MTSSEKKSKIFGLGQMVENPEKVKQFLEELCQNIPRDKKDLETRKHEFSKREVIETIQNRDLIAACKSRTDIPENLLNLFSKRAVRTISGVTPIGILTKPYACPGKCVYCPTEDRMPKSYMSNQPAAARALRNKFHPFDQVSNRIRAIEESGHPVSKLEVIVMGGTWSFLPHKYQMWYIKRCFDAANGGKNCALPSGQKHSRLLESSAPSLKEAQKINETADKRIIGLTLETRPDFINERELVRMRKYGCTRIEIGVQTLDDEIQKYTKRGHYKKHVIKAMKLMKDFGFKICWHLMPGLPGTDPERDLKWMLEVFEDPMCRPDMIKIYPCVVLETAELKKWWEEGRYQPYRDEDLIPLLLKWQHFVPEYCRVMRLMRDIPVSNILDGAKFSNLRQIIKDQPEKIREIVGDDFYQEHIKGKKYWVCKDIRSREVGFAKGIELGEPILKRRDYEASDGQEVFLSFETEDEEHLFSLLRLRKPSGQKFTQFGSVLHNAALIREVHSYGSEVSIGEEKGMGQHRGLGRKMIEEAERIARDEWGMKKMTIIAGVGTREYYKKWGYEEKSTYMVKEL